MAAAMETVLCSGLSRAAPVSRPATSSCQPAAPLAHGLQASKSLCSSSYRGQALVASRQQSRCSSARQIVLAAAVQSPPTVADTKRKFMESYSKPVPAIYSTVIQELLVQQHLLRYNKNYQYDEVFALGFVSVFDQVLEGLPEATRKAVFSAYINALDEDPAQYRQDAQAIEQWASGLSGPSDIRPSADGDEVQQKLAAIAERSAAKKFLYTKFFAIGLFRLLELTGAKDPKALEALVKSMNVTTESVNRDLMTYKGVLSKLAAAKELMAEYLERERRKQAEREAEKAAKAQAAADKEAQPVSADASA